MAAALEHAQALLHLLAHELSLMQNDKDFVKKGKVDRQRLRAFEQICTQLKSSSHNAKNRDMFLQQGLLEMLAELMPLDNWEVKHGVVQVIKAHAADEQLRVLVSPQHMQLLPAFDDNIAALTKRDILSEEKKDQLMNDPDDEDEAGKKTRKSYLGRLSVMVMKKGFNMRGIKKPIHEAGFVDEDRPPNGLHIRVRQIDRVSEALGLSELREEGLEYLLTVMETLRLLVSHPTNLLECGRHPLFFHLLFDVFNAVVTHPHSELVQERQSKEENKVLAAARNVPKKKDAIQAKDPSREEAVEIKAKSEQQKAIELAASSLAAAAEKGIHGEQMQLALLEAIKMVNDATFGVFELLKHLQDEVTEILEIVFDHPKLLDMFCRNKLASGRLWDHTGLPGFDRSPADLSCLNWYILVRHLARAKVVHPFLISKEYGNEIVSFMFSRLSRLIPVTSSTPASAVQLKQTKEVKKRVFDKLRNLQTVKAIKLLNKEIKEVERRERVAARRKIILQKAREARQINDNLEDDGGTEQNGGEEIADIIVEVDKAQEEKKDDANIIADAFAELRDEDEIATLKAVDWNLGTERSLQVRQHVGSVHSNMPRSRHTVINSEDFSNRKSLFVAPSARFSAANSIAQARASDTDFVGKMITDRAGPSQSLREAGERILGTSHSLKRPNSTGSMISTKSGRGSPAQKSQPRSSSAKRLRKKRPSHVPTPQGKAPLPPQSPFVRASSISTSLERNMGPPSPLAAPPPPPKAPSPNGPTTNKVIKKGKNQALIKRIVEEEKKRMNKQLGMFDAQQDDEVIMAENRKKAFQVLVDALEEEQNEKQDVAVFVKLGLISDILNAFMTTPIGMAVVSFVDDFFRYELWRVLFVAKKLSALNKVEESKLALKARGMKATFERPAHELFRNPPVQVLSSFFQLLVGLARASAPTLQEIHSHKNKAGDDSSQLGIILASISKLKAREEQQQRNMERKVEAELQQFGQEDNVIKKLHLKNLQKSQEHQLILFPESRAGQALPLLHLSPLPAAVENLMELMELFGSWVAESQGAEEAYRVASQLGVGNSVPHEVVVQARDRRQLLTLVVSLVCKIRADPVHTLQSLAFVSNFSQMTALTIPRGLSEVLIRLLAHGLAIYKQHYLIVAYSLSVMFQLLLREHTLPLDAKVELASQLKLMMLPQSFELEEQRERKHAERLRALNPSPAENESKEKDFEFIDDSINVQSNPDKVPSKFARASRFCLLSLRLGLLTTFIHILNPLARMSHRILLPPLTGDEFDRARIAVQSEGAAAGLDDAEIALVYQRLRARRIPHNVAKVLQDMEANKLRGDSKDRLDLATFRFHTEMISMLNTCMQVLFDRHEDIESAIKEERLEIEIRDVLISRFEEEKNKLKAQLVAVEKGAEDAKQVAELIGYRSRREDSEPHDNSKRIRQDYSKLANSLQQDVNRNNSAQVPSFHGEQLRHSLSGDSRRYEEFVLPHPPCPPQPPPPEMVKSTSTWTRLTSWLAGESKQFSLKTTAERLPVRDPPAAPPPPPPPPLYSQLSLQDEEEIARLERLERRRKNLRQETNSDEDDNGIVYNSSDDLIDETPRSHKEKRQEQVFHEKQGQILKAAVSKIKQLRAGGKAFQLQKNLDNLPQGPPPKLKERPRGMFEAIAEKLVRNAIGLEKKREDDLRRRPQGAKGHPSRVHSASFSDSESQSSLTESKAEDISFELIEENDPAEWDNLNTDEKRGEREVRKIERRREWDGLSTDEKRLKKKERKRERRKKRKHENAENLDLENLGENLAEQVNGLSHLGVVGDLLRKRGNFAREDLKARNRLKEAVKLRGELMLKELQEKIESMEQRVELARELRLIEENQTSANKYPALCSPLLCSFLCSVAARLRQIVMFRTRARGVLTVLRFNQSLLLNLVSFVCQQNYLCWRIFEYPEKDFELEEFGHTIGLDGKFIPYAFESKKKAHERVRALVQSGSVGLLEAWGDRTHPPGDCFESLTYVLAQPFSRSRVFVRDMVLTLADVLANMFHYKLFQVSASKDLDVTLSFLEHIADSSEGMTLFLDEMHVVALFRALNHLLATSMKNVQGVGGMESPRQDDNAEDSFSSLSSDLSDATQQDLVDAVGDEETLINALQIKPTDHWSMVASKRRRQRRFLRKKKQKNREARRAKIKTEEPKEDAKFEKPVFTLLDYVSRLAKLIYRVLLLHPLTGPCFVRNTDGVISKTTGFICSIINNMHSNHRWAFQQHESFHPDIQPFTDKNLTPLVALLYCLSSVARYADITYSTGAMYTLLTLIALKDRESVPLPPYRFHALAKNLSLPFGVAVTGLLHNVVSWRRVRLKITHSANDKKGVGDPHFLRVLREVVHMYSAEAIRPNREQVRGVNENKREEREYFDLASRLGHHAAKETIFVNREKKKEKAAGISEVKFGSEGVHRDRKEIEERSDQWSSIMLALFSVMTILTIKQQRLIEIEGRDSAREKAQTGLQSSTSLCIPYFSSLTPILWHHVTLLSQPWPVSQIKPPWGFARLKGLSRVERKKNKEWRKLMVTELQVSLQNFQPRFVLSLGVRTQWLEMLRQLNSNLGASVLEQGRIQLRNRLGHKVKVQAGEGVIAGLMSEETAQRLMERNVLRREEVWDRFQAAYERHKDEREQENTLEMEAARIQRLKRREREQRERDKEIAIAVKKAEQEARGVRRTDLDELIAQVESEFNNKNESSGEDDLIDADAGEDKVNVVEWVDSEFVGVLMDGFDD